MKDSKHLDNLMRPLEHNKDGMEGRWTKVSGIAGRDSAISEIERSRHTKES